MEGEIRSFSDKKRLNEYTSTKQALQDMLGEILKKSKKKSEKEKKLVALAFLIKESKTKYPK